MPEGRGCARSACGLANPLIVEVLVTGYGGMKLTLLTNGIPPSTMGGMQTHSLSMAKQLAEDGVRVDLYFPCVDRRAFPAPLHENISLNPFNPVKHRRTPGHYLAEARALSENYLEFYRHQPPSDLIYAKGLMGGAFLNARDEAKFPSTPIITNVHGYECFQQPATLVERLRAALLKPAFRRVICRSDFVVSYGGRISDLLTDRLGISHRKILEIPGAVDRRFMAPLQNASPKPNLRFGFVGRYERRKGLEEIAKVMTSLDVDLDFQVVGPVPSTIQKQFSSSVIFHGSMASRQALVSFLDELDVLICPSWSEGMPNVIMEAMSRATAIVATDVGANCLLVDDQNGRLIPPFDQRRLKEGLMEMHQLDATELRLKKARSRTRIEQAFQWDIVGRTLVDALISISDSNRQAA